jgi:hypothetical protein
MATRTYRVRMLLTCFSTDGWVRHPTVMVVLEDEKPTRRFSCLLAVLPKHPRYFELEIFLGVEVSSPILVGCYDRPPLTKRRN